MLPRFSALLWLEELQAERELREFSISGALLRKGAGYLHLEVPGLSEGRPNLFIGEEQPCQLTCLYQCSILTHYPLNVVLFYDFNVLKPCVWSLTGDKVVLKKPCDGGFVVEYISYVTEVLYFIKV